MPTSGGRYGPSAPILLSLSLSLSLSWVQHMDALMKMY